jgi:hypothetical protein
VHERPLWEGLGYAGESSEDESPVIRCIHYQKFRHDIEHCWEKHPELTSEWFQTRQGKQEDRANNNANSELWKKGEKVERYKSPSPTFTDEHARVMNLIRKMIPCTFCTRHNHYVVDYWKQKVYERNIMVTRSTPRCNDMTLQVKKNLREKSVHPGQELEKSKGDSTQSRRNSIKFIQSRNTCSHCQKSEHCEDSCWRLHPELRCSTKPEGPR